MLDAAHAGKGQIRKGGALGKGEPEAAGKTHDGLGQDNTDQQAQGWQLQDRKAEIQPREGIGLAEGHGQQGW